MSYSALKKNLQKILKERDWSVSLLERKVGVSKQQSVQNIFRGISKNPSIELVYGIAKALNVSVEELLQDIQNDVIEDFDLFADACLKVISEIKTIDSSNITPYNLFKIIDEVYSYSHQMKLTAVESTFVKWTIMKYYKSTEVATV